jgi:FMN-dependent NADH-azoreductase
VSRAGRTFAYDPVAGPKGLLRGKSAVLVSSSGTDPAQLAAGGHDFAMPYLTKLLGFLGITDVEVVQAWGAVAADVERTTADARRRLGELAQRSVSSAA